MRENIATDHSLSTLALSSPFHQYASSSRNMPDQRSATTPSHVASPAHVGDTARNPHVKSDDGSLQAPLKKERDQRRALASIPLYGTALKADPSVKIEQGMDTESKLEGKPDGCLKNEEEEKGVAAHPHGGTSYLACCPHYNM